MKANVVGVANLNAKMLVRKLEELSIKASEYPDVSKSLPCVVTGGDNLIIALKRVTSTNVPFFLIESISILTNLGIPILGMKEVTHGRWIVSNFEQDVRQFLDEPKSVTLVNGATYRILKSIAKRKVEMQLAEDKRKMKANKKD